MASLLHAGALNEVQLFTSWFQISSARALCGPFSIMRGRYSV
jgi:hypothetical protein